MPHKPHLTLIDIEPLDELPKDAYNDFRELVLNVNIKPSKALRSVMRKYECNDVHVLSVIRLIEHTYPDIDISRQDFRGSLVDSTYPKNLNQFSDEDFDTGIDELLSLPPEKW